jgi:hypothetical protein
MDLRRGSNSRSGAVLCAWLALALSFTGTALAAKPAEGSNGQPAGDTYASPLTPEQAAFQQEKQAFIVAINDYAETGTSNDSPNGAISPNMLCATDCGGGGGSSGPPTSKILDVRARKQTTLYYCGPASGQMVMNYSRGYFFDTLDGESTTKNWRTQSDIASSMKTSPELGTSGDNLAKTLNAPAGVQKPVANWSYVYAINSDGKDMHDKVVADIYGYSMPLVIAVMPHDTGKPYYLPNWPKAAAGVRHWIVIRGYYKLWDGTDTPQVYYSDPSGNGGFQAGSYVTGALTMWKVNKYNRSTIVW